MLGSAWLVPRWSSLANLSPCSQGRRDWGRAASVLVNSVVERFPLQAGPPVDVAGGTLHNQQATTLTKKTAKQPATKRRHKVLPLWRLNQKPLVGLEPTTYALRKRRSTG